MYLKSIELQGFKSFPEKTVLNFEKGISVIIGPNGSGKSNIADAMRWVLGEVSSRNIRGTKMEDVIFGGCATKKMSSFAQVSLTLDNTDSEHKLNIDYDTVTVTRRYFRGGDSEYLINGKAVRLKDIHKLFMNTGIGREGYSVIGQGKIAEIISQKSEERRHVFEEAAGISKYKFSKAEAEKKLAATDDNLTRIYDISTELGSRVEPLSRASEKAQKYLVLYEEKKQLDVALWLYDMADSAKTISALKGNYELYKDELERTSAELDALEKRTEELFSQSQRIKYETEKENVRFATLTEEKAGRSGKIISAKGEIEHIRQSLTANAEALQKLEERLKICIEAQNEKSKELSVLEEKHKAQKELCSAESAKYEEITKTLEALSEKADETENKINELSQKLIDLRIKITVYDTEDKAAKQQDEQALAEAEKHDLAADEIKARIEKAKVTVEGYEKQQKDREEQSIKLKQEADRAEKEIEDAKTQSGDMYVKISTLTHRAESLSRMQELFEGYSQSVKFVMDENKKGRVLRRDGSKAEIYAPVSMLISVDGKYATAVETTLGASMQNIVVKDEEDAKSAIAHLKKNNAGRCTFYPVSTVKAQYLQYSKSELLKCDGFVSLANELVECKDEFRGVIDSLLARTAVFTDIDKASAFAKKFGYKVRVVTLDGQQINAGGSFTGGSKRNDSGMLSRSAEIEKITKEADALKVQKEALDKKISELSSKEEKLRAEISEHENASKILSSLYSAEKAQFDVLVSKEQDERARADELRFGSESDKQRRAERLAQKQRDEELIAATEKECEALREQLVSLEEEIKVKNGEQMVSREAGGKLLVALTEISGEISTVSQALSMIVSQREEFEAERDGLIRKSEELNKKLNENIEIVTSAESGIGQTEGEIAEVKENIASLSQKGKEVEEALAYARGAERDKNHSKELILREFTQAEAKLARATEEREKLSTSLVENYELSYSEAKELAEERNYPKITPKDRGEYAKTRAELKNKIKALGEVNVNAIEEYKEVKERYDFMTAQIVDLQKSKEELLEIITNLEEEMRVAFTESFARINVCFKQVFTRLFGGGSAELILKDPDDVLNSGIEINAAPPGKIIKSLSLLSGGEQSFVAIALYFALIQVNPTPFIMLDEIDSALDEVNVDRFGQYLTECKDSTQFVLISHRRGTMESADRLYGVTMPVKGISRILSVDIGEIEQKIGKLD